MLEHRWSAGDIRVSVVRGHVMPPVRRTCWGRRTWPRCYWQPGEWRSRRVDNDSGRSPRCGRTADGPVWQAHLRDTASPGDDRLRRLTVNTRWNSSADSLHTFQHSTPCRQKKQTPFIFSQQLCEDTLYSDNFWDANASMNVRQSRYSNSHLSWWEFLQYLVRRE